MGMMFLVCISAHILRTFFTFHFTSPLIGCATKTVFTARLAVLLFAILCAIMTSFYLVCRLQKAPDKNNPAKKDGVLQTKYNEILLREHIYFSLSEKHTFCV